MLPLGGERNVSNVLLLAARERWVYTTIYYILRGPKIRMNYGRHRGARCALMNYDVEAALNTRTVNDDEIYTVRDD